MKARVKRDGQWTEIEAARLVPGDIVRLRLGDIIPADVILSDGDYLSVDQSGLTGESLPADKKIGELAYSSSVAKQGEMDALVTATRAATYFGKTAKLVLTDWAIAHNWRRIDRSNSFRLIRYESAPKLLWRRRTAAHLSPLLKKRLR